MSFQWARRKGHSRQRQSTHKEGGMKQHCERLNLNIFSGAETGGGREGVGVEVGKGNQGI